MEEDSESPQAFVRVVKGPLDLLQTTVDFGYCCYLTEPGQQQQLLRQQRMDLRETVFDFALRQENLYQARLPTPVD